MDKVHTYNSFDTIVLVLRVSGEQKYGCIFCVTVARLT
jgi:hypothetical protein